MDSPEETYHSSFSASVGLEHIPVLHLFQHTKIKADIFKYHWRKEVINNLGIQLATPTISAFFCNSVFSWSRSEMTSWRSFCNSSFSWLIDEICSLSWKEWLLLSANNWSFSHDTLFSVSVNCWTYNKERRKNKNYDLALVSTPLWSTQISRVKYKELNFQ